MAKGGYRPRGGRPRKPTALKVIQGTFRADRHGDEPTTPKGLTKWPEPPSWLNVRERTLWAELQHHCEAWSSQSDFLAINGVVSLADRLLKNQEMQQSTNLKSIITNTFTKRGWAKNEHGQFVQTIERKVEVHESPLVSQEIKLWKELRAYLGLMGLSPADRARMQPTDQGEKQKPSALSDLIKRGRQR